MMQLGEYIRLDFRRIKREGGERIVKLINPNEARVVVIVKTANRDTETGKFTYVTEKSIDVYQAKAAEVISVVEKALAAATGDTVPVKAATPAAKPAQAAKK